jgi:glyoxylase-like metal-dependent hydrolase (beta-lactamase superfamily II)
MLKITRYGEVTRFDLARTLAGKGRYWTTAYLVGETLIDSGCAFSAPELVQALQGVPLRRIINTHTHEDHIGANGRLQASHPGLKILAHPLALPVLADPRACQPLHPYRRVFWGWPQPSRAEPVRDGSLVEDGSFCFLVVYTPGHSPDHICLYEPERRWLFTGDLFVGGRDRAIRAGYDIHQIVASLKRVAALVEEPSPKAGTSYKSVNKGDDEPVLFPGSARVRHAPFDEITAKIAYYEEQGRHVLELHQNGYSLPKIARQVFGPAMWIEVVTLGHFTRQRLVRSYLGTNHEKPPTR